MFETVENSLSLIKDLKNFFIHSCDCFGLFNKKRFINFLKNKNPMLFYLHSIFQTFKENYLMAILRFKIIQFIQ